MSVPAHIFNLQNLRRFDGPEYFLGGGFLAGLLVFLIWLAGAPDHGPRSLRAHEGGEATVGGLAAPDDGVLSGITGESAAPGRAATVTNDFGLPGEGEFVEDTQQQAEADAEAGMDSDSMAIGDEVGEPVEMSEGAALTDGLLGPPSAAAAGDEAQAASAPLQTYYVEVEVAPGQVQVLQLKAESPEHARAILRDFRGDPRVLRGPSTEALP
jgi:hypothetical protein